MLLGAFRNWKMKTTDLESSAASIDFMILVVIKVDETLYGRTDTLENKVHIRNV